MKLPLHTRTHKFSPAPCERLLDTICWLEKLRLCNSDLAFDIYYYKWKFCKTKDLEVVKNKLLLTLWDYKNPQQQVLGLLTNGNVSSIAVIIVKVFILVILFQQN